VELKDYLRIIKRRWILVLALTLAVGGGNFLFFNIKPEQFQASCRVIVKQMPDYVVIERDFPTVFPQVSLQTRLSLIRSDSVLKRTVWHARQHFPGVFKDETSAQGVANPQDPGQTVTDLPAFDADAMQNAIDLLKTIVAYVAEKDTENVLISCRDSSSERAKDIANAVGRAFRENSIIQSNEFIQSALQFLTNRKGELLIEIKTLQDQVSSENQKQELIAAAKGGGLQPPDLLAQEAEIRKLELDIHQVGGEIEGYEKQLSGCDLFGTTEGGEPADITALRNQLTVLQEELAKLATRYKPEHLQVQETEKKIRKTEELIAQREKSATIVKSVQEKRRMLGKLEELKIKRTQFEGQISHLDAMIRDKRREFEEKLKQQLNQQQQLPAPEVAQLALMEFKLKSAQDSLLQMVSRETQLSLMKTLNDPLISIESPARDGAPLPKQGAGTWPLAVIVGLVIGVAAAYFLEYINTTVRTEHDVRRYVNLPLLGMVIRIKDKDQRILLNVAPKMPLCEVFNTAGTLLEAYAIEHKAKVFLLTSCKAEEGKSTMSANIAIALARSGERVVLFDCDLRKAVLHKTFGVDNSKGISTYVMSHSAQNLDGATPMPFDKVLVQTEVENLRLMPAGPHPQNPVGVLKSEALKGAIREAREMADIVLIDVPPVSLAVDTLVLAPQADGIIFVVAAGETHKDEIAYAKRIIEGAHGNLIGCILNKVSLESHGYYYYYYYYYDTYKYYRET
jgi:succinoglycan biosynthesis transport protein ExoP